MNAKPLAILRLGASILVLAAFLTPHGTLAEPQPSQIPLPNQKSIVNSCVDSALACSGAQILPGPFTKSTENPILEPGGVGSWEENGAIRPSVTWADGTYRMWYTGSNATFTSAIGYATSANGTVWTKETTNPVLENGDPGTWDDYSVSYGRGHPGWRWI